MGANGANLSFPEELGIKDNGWPVGTINSGPTLCGTFSTWLADPISNRLGRRGTVFFCGLFSIFLVLGQAVTQNWLELFLSRLPFEVGYQVRRLC